MKDIQEKKISSVNGWVMVVIDLAVFFFSGRYLVTHADMVRPGAGMFLAVLAAILAFMTFGGFFLIHPNESKVFTFLGKYVGSARTSGFFWTNPFAVKKKVTLRIFNFNSETLKVNDALGNPIEIAAVVVWNVVDSAKALFNVESYQNFVAVQSETAIRQLATHYPYDAHDKDTESLRANPDEIAAKLLDVRDPETGLQVISHVYKTSQVYHGPHAKEAPDLIIGYNEGYRASWDGVTGIVDDTVIEDNGKAWSGDHCIDPALVPGVLFSSLGLKTDKPSIMDIAPTVLELFGIAPPPHMDGRGLIDIAGLPAAAKGKTR